MSYAGGGGGARYASPTGGGNGGSGGGGKGGSENVSPQGAIDGSVNTGGGGGGNRTPSAGGGTGGSGIVIVKEPAFAKASGVWPLSEQYNLKKNNQWTG